MKYQEEIEQMKEIEETIRRLERSMSKRLNKQTKDLVRINSDLKEVLRISQRTKEALEEILGIKTNTPLQSPHSRKS